MKVKESTGTEKTPMAEGFHRARLFSIIDLGTQVTKFGPKRQLRLYYESLEPNEQIEFHKEKGKEPRIVFLKENITVHDGIFKLNWKRSNLGKHIAAFLGSKRLTPELRKGFDLAFLLGKCGYITITHNKTEDRTFENITSAAPPKEEDKTNTWQKAHNNFMLFDLSGEPCMYYDIEKKEKNDTLDVKDAFKMLWPGLREKVASSDEGKALGLTFSKDEYEDQDHDTSEAIEEEMVEENDEENVF